ncbi:hypothetical protein HAT92_01478 [Dickeya solani]|nr:hypothetical protein HAT92_01478 [Dickeya solani]
MLLDVRQVEKSYWENRGHFFSKRKRAVIKMSRSRLGTAIASVLSAKAAAEKVPWPA